MKLEGIHHVTAITADAPGNVDFYTRVLGLRLVKKTVNQDDPTVYHLFYADEQGSPGADLTFFDDPDLSELITEGRDLFRAAVTPELFKRNYYDRAIVDRVIKPMAALKSPIW